MGVLPRDGEPHSRRWACPFLSPTLAGSSDSRTLCRLHTEIDFLFFSDSWFVWHAEAEYARLKKELEVTGEVPDDLKTSTHLKEKISLDSAAA